MILYICQKEKGLKMFITKINDEQITFNDGSYITFDHMQDCCEYNYADFSILTAHNEKIFKLHFSKVDIRPKNEGFILSLDNHKYWIPCYSEQNGYYTCDITIYYMDKYNDLIKEINLECKFYEI
jgi:hypothetical protein